MMTTTETPRIWIGCLAAYNDGDLHGEWVDATDADELEEARARVLASSPISGAEEAFIADTEGFGDLIGEYTPLADVAELGALIEEHGPAFLAYVNNVGAEYATASGFEEAYQGEWDDEEAFGYNLADDMIEELRGDSTLARYFDYSAWSRDLFMGDYWSADNPTGGVFVFLST